MKKPAKDKWVLTKIATLSFFIRMVILLLPFKYLATFLGKQNKTAVSEMKSTIDKTVVESVTRQIKNVSSYVPWDSNCLVQATVGKILLRKERIDSTVCFGVKKEDNKMKAHAWLRVGPDIILGGEIASQFTEVSSFS